MVCTLSHFSAYLRSFRCPCNIASYFSKMGVSVSSSSLSGSCVASVSVVTPNGKANKQTILWELKLSKTLRVSKICLQKDHCLHWGLQYVSPVVFVKFCLFKKNMVFFRHYSSFSCLLMVFLFYWFSKELFGRSHFQIMHTQSGFYFANSHLANSPLTFAFLFPWFSVSVHPQNMLRDFSIIVRVHL